MTARMFRLMLMHQRIDERLRLELRKRAPDLGEFARLQLLRSRAKRLFARLARRAAPA
ncbi:DUF465 domain-containing protein [Qipengyuania sp. 902]|uniref:DUF465 domain-containing protein n=1 Tax=Qipengyuania sp. 902 TaxID=3417565 RepID=UPI003EB73304